MLGRSALRASLIGSVFSARPMSTGSDWRTRVRQPDCPSRWPYSDADFQRIDESSDLEFYAPPRLVHHIDDGCRAALAAYYDDVLPSKSATPLSAIKVLDLCSSWVSHLPARLDDKKQYHVLGLGMNARELAANEQLSRWLVKDLNQDASLPVETAENESFDAAICSVSIDYLVRPREILREIGRLLKKGSSVHLAFSNRMFATKVVGRWLRISEDERCQMVADYLHFATNSQGDPIFANVEIVTVIPKEGWGSSDPLWVIRATKRT